MSISDLSPSNIITGATDETEIGNVSDSLKVNVTNNDDDALKVDPRPPFNVIYIDDLFANGSSTSMVVNGSSTSQDFEIGPPAGQIWYVDAISIIITDSGSTDVVDFGAISGGLSNGVQLIQEINSTEYVIGNYTNNAALSGAFIQQQVLSSDSGWFDSSDFFHGSKEFKPQIILNGDDGDKLIFRIRDDIRGLNNFKATVKAWRKL